MINIPQYLQRLNFTESLKPASATLHALQLAHMRSIPFENLDIGLGRRIKLDLPSLWQKVIVDGRGGFCYELNGLFAWLLQQIRFEVTYLNARDYHEETDSFGIDFDHLTLLVKAPHESTRWLADVGWGDTFFQPLDIDNPNEQVQGLRGYWVKPFKDGCIIWQRNYDGSQERHYFFDLIPHRFPEEYLETCEYHQTSPSSPFTKNRIISRVTEDGRISLDRDALIVTSNGSRTITAVSEEQWESLLKEHFGITLKKCTEGLFRKPSVQ
ncbi:MAG: arylamine N-acetyltransferase [Anaerolineales bacterium]|nr:arylamine N-acetyltransferase [Anaerolineales bacterium]